MRKKWTDEEIQFLKFAYPNKDFTNKEIFEAFNDRTEAQIRAMAHKLGIKRYKEVYPDGYKRCTLCKIILPLEDFAKDKRNTIHGRTSACKKCLCEYEKLRRIKKEVIKPSEVKMCSKCKTEKPLMDFHKDSQSKDGVRPNCKDCVREYDRKRIVSGGYNR